nr:uncharacterized protein LOC127305780 isoform X1 [Lolium perenne]XP_051192269.1 uncharacterized protein LOC127305780 isoform X2 [Lolium perenne]
MQPSNPSPHLFHPRAAAPSFPSTTQTSETKVSEKTPNTSTAASPSPVVSDHLSLNQGHHEFLLVTLKLLYTRAPPISHEIDAQIVVLRFARHAPARFPTASDLLRPFRDHQCVPGFHRSSSGPCRRHGCRRAGLGPGSRFPTSPRSIPTSSAARKPHPRLPLPRHRRTLSLLRLPGRHRPTSSSFTTSSASPRYEDMFDEDDVSKVTLPAWPGQGYGRHWLSSGLLVQFVSCPYSDVFDLLYDLDLCIVYLYLDSLESLL